MKVILHADDFGGGGAHVPIAGKIQSLTMVPHGPVHEGNFLIRQFPVESEILSYRLDVPGVCINGNHMACAANLLLEQDAGEARVCPQVEHRIPSLQVGKILILQAGDHRFGQGCEFDRHQVEAHHLVVAGQGIVHQGIAVPIQGFHGSEVIIEGVMMSLM